MPFRDPFKRSKDIDQTYLRISINNFLLLDGKSSQFYDTIKELNKIRDILQVSDQIGRLGELPGAQFYLEAIKWLGLNSPIQNGVAVSQISNYEDINDAIASSFFQFVEWIRNNYFANNAFSQQIQIAIGVGKADKIQKLDRTTDKLEEAFQEDLLTSQGELSSAIDRQRDSLNVSLNEQFDNQKTQIEQTGENALNLIEQAQSLAAWKEYYRENVELYEHKLNGRNWKNLEPGGRLKNFRDQLGGRIKNYKRNKPKMWMYLWYVSTRLLMLLFYVVLRSAKFLSDFVYESIGYLIGKLFSIKGRRLLWFSILSAVLVAQAVIVFLVVSDPHIHGEFSLRIQQLLQKEYLGAKISAFLGFVLVPSLGYATSNRNYRIYSNLLEQYRHRETVAQTLQGILRSIAENEDNRDIRQSLAAVAAVAMFELKTVGHLTKNTDTGFPLSEIFQGLFGSK